MHRHAQSSLEFVILVAAMVFFFLMILAAVSEQHGIRAEKERAFLVKDTAIGVQHELVLASGAQDGYERTFTVPPTLLNHPYNLTLVDDFVYIALANGRESLALSVPKVNGTLIIGANTIRKIDGRVFVNVP